MERKKKNRALELGKNLLILALVLTAVYLTLRSQLSSQLGGDAPQWLKDAMSFIDHGPGAIAAPEGGEGQPMELRPLRMAVHIPGVGRYGLQYDSATADRLFDEEFATILGEALGSARVPLPTTEQAWRHALTNQIGVYFDFQSTVPLGVLYTWLEAGPGTTLAEISTRRLLLTEAADGALLLYFNEEATGKYYVCQTADTLKGHLQPVASASTPNVNATVFAFEKKGEPLNLLTPYTLLPGKSPLRRTVYQVTNPIVERQDSVMRSGLMEALGFQPQSNSSYTAGDRLVVKEGADTLVVYDNGGVDYHSTSLEGVRYPVGEGGASITPLQIMRATRPLVEGAVGARCGDAQLYLMGIEDLGAGRWQAEYGYHLNGITVRLGEEGYAARFIISDGRISDFYLVLRAYTATANYSAVLPEEQAVAAMSALNAKGQELALVYEDSLGGERVHAGWIAS